MFVESVRSKATYNMSARITTESDIMMVSMRILEKQSFYITGKI